MKKYITFGNWNKSYLHIIASFASLVLFNVFDGFCYYFYGVQLSDRIFNRHIYIHKIYYQNNIKFNKISINNELYKIIIKLIFSD